MEVGTGTGTGTEAGTGTAAAAGAEAAAATEAAAGTDVVAYSDAEVGDSTPSTIIAMCTVPTRTTPNAIEPSALERREARAGGAFGFATDGARFYS